MKCFDDKKTMQSVRIKKKCVTLWKITSCRKICVINKIVFIVTKEIWILFTKTLNFALAGEIFERSITRSVIFLCYLSVLRPVIFLCYLSVIFYLDKKDK